LPEILVRASSGGVMTALADYLITTGQVEGAVVTGMQYGSPGPRPRTFLARNRRELLQAQGSKYCPSSPFLALTEAMKTSERFLFLGTPCQIAALRMLQERRPELRRKFPFAIGNFCGGFRDFRETDMLILREGFSPSEVTEFRYRGGGQPGYMSMENDQGLSARRPYPEYSRRTGYIKNWRCRLCVDATAELADFSCGDAWLPRFLQSGQPWSIIMTRTPEATSVIEAMCRGQWLLLRDVSVDEIQQSQRDNLTSKKTRQAARRRLYSLLGYAMPEFDGGFEQTDRGLLLEAKVLMTHVTLYSMERLGLYPVFGKLLGRY
jgi:coenzyme F420 hydrogenase subunit beta